MKKEKNNRNKNTVMVAAALLVAAIIIIITCIDPETALRLVAAVTIAIVYRLSKDTRSEKGEEKK